jgi:hypothetical protein
MLRFSVPGVAAEAVNIERLEADGRAAGIVRAVFTYQFAYWPAGDRNK